MTYTVLDKKLLPEYVSRLPSVMDVLGHSRDLTIEEIGDGNLNYVYRLRRTAHPERSVIVKQAVPYLRMAGEDWPLSRDRMLFEIRALQEYNSLVPQFVPKIHHADEHMSVLIMQDLNDHQVVRGRMIEGTVFPKIGAHIGIFLAETLFRTSFLGMGSISRRHLMQKFNLNDELCKLTEDFIFTFPYMEHESNWDTGATSEHAREIIRTDTEYKLRLLKFKELFVTKADALVHGDLHTGSLMANGEETYVIDTEFAFFGPFGFDVGKIIANFLMSYTSHFFHSKGSKYQEWLLNEALVIWNTFERRFLELWNDVDESALLTEGLLTDREADEYKRSFMFRIFQEAIGFCACSIARRTLGIAGVIDIRGIEDEAVRTELEKMHIKLSHFLMMNYEKILDIRQFKSAIESFYDSNTPRWAEKRS